MQGINNSLSQFYSRMNVSLPEMVNTAIEVVIDKVSPQYSALAKVGKDVAAGAVFVSALAAVIVGITLFWDLERFEVIFKYNVLMMHIHFQCFSLVECLT